MSKLISRNFSWNWFHGKTDISLPMRSCLEDADFNLLVIKLAAPKGFLSIFITWVVCPDAPDVLDEDKIRDRRFTSFSLVDTSANEISQPLGSDSVPE